MFDIGFPELLLVSVVALLVVGPDRLPETIRTMALWIGRLRRSFANIRQEIENEIGADEIRAQLYNESIMQDIKQSRETLQEVKNDVAEAFEQVNASVSDLNSDTTLKPQQLKDQDDDQSRNSSG
ncbi:MAG: twin-arginine translocase subunit TatB [Proteobacteria bacterium]|nr:twin-arginine translocase subunit TatB [Pseudomonadota bacterium]